VKRARLLLLVALMLAIAVPAGAYTYILHYVTQKQGAIRVVENCWTVELYRFSNFSGRIDLIDFGGLEEPAVDTWVNTTVYWLGNVKQRNPIWVFWNYSAPEGWRVKAYYGAYLDGKLQGFIEWKPFDGTPTEECALDVSRAPWIRRVKWSIMVPANTTAGEYEVTINLYAYERS